MSVPYALAAAFRRSTTRYATAAPSRRGRRRRVLGATRVPHWQVWTVHARRLNVQSALHERTPAMQPKLEHDCPLTSPRSHRSLPSATPLPQIGVAVAAGIGVAVCVGSGRAVPPAREPSQRKKKSGLLGSAVDCG